MDVRGKLDPGYPPGANGDSSGSAKKCGFCEQFKRIFTPTQRFTSPVSFCCVFAHHFEKFAELSVVFHENV